MDLARFMNSCLIPDPQPGGGGGENPLTDLQTPSQTPCASKGRDQPQPPHHVSTRLIPSGLGMAILVAYIVCQHYDIAAIFHNQKDQIHIWGLFQT
jgi:hypothetical protein